MPAAAAAFASMRSPSRRTMPFMPVGAMIRGALISEPKSWVRWWRFVVSTSVWGTKRQDSNALRLQRSVASSSEPPSTYSKTKFGTARLAMSLRCPMFSARERSLSRNGRRRQGIDRIPSEGDARLAGLPVRAKTSAPDAEGRAPTEFRYRLLARDGAVVLGNVVDAARSASDRAASRFRRGLHVHGPTFRRGI